MCRKVPNRWLPGSVPEEDKRRGAEQKGGRGGAQDKVEEEGSESQRGHWTGRAFLEVPLVGEGLGPSTPPLTGSKLSF